MDVNRELWDRVVTDTQGAGTFGPLAHRSRSLADGQFRPADLSSVWMLDSDSQPPHILFN